MRACTDYGIVIERQRYLDGHSQGMRNYYRIENAVELGRVCPAYDVYRLRQELDSITYQRDRKEDKLRTYDLSRLPSIF